MHKELSEILLKFSKKKKLTERELLPGLLPAT